MPAKTAYSADELNEFKEIILTKIESAQEDLAILRAATSNAVSYTHLTLPTKLEV